MLTASEMHLDAGNSGLRCSISTIQPAPDAAFLRRLRDRNASRDGDAPGPAAQPVGNANRRTWLTVSLARMGG